MPRPRVRLLPSWMPQWIQRRAEVDSYALYEFAEASGASVPAGARVLDAGAGEGRYRPEFAHTRYVGLDLAVGDVAWNYSGLDAIGDLVSLPFAAGTFDAAICMEVLEHVPEPLLVLQEICRVLRPGGRLFFSAPQSHHQHQKPHDYFRYTSFGLRHLFNRAGLTVQTIEPMGGYFWFLAFQLQNINYWLFPRGMRWRPLTWPLRVFNAIVFQVIVSLAFFYLDRLDRQKDETFGYVAVASKPSAAGGEN